MLIPVNKDLDSYQDDFFKGLTLKQTALSLISIAAGTGTFLIGTYLLHLEESVSFYLALPVVLPIAASGFLKIQGMTPVQYLKKRRNAMTRDIWFFVPAMLAPEPEKETEGEKRVRRYLLDEPDESYGERGDA